EREVKDRDRVRSKRFAEDQPERTAKLVPVEGSGLSGPFIRRPVMTVLLTLSVIVAGLATYGKLAVNDLPAVDYPVIQVTCSYPARHGEIADRSAESAHIHENKSERSSRLLVRPAF